MEWKLRIFQRNKPFPYTLGMHIWTLSLHSFQEGSDFRFAFRWQSVLIAKTSSKVVAQLNMFSCVKRHIWAVYEKTQKHRKCSAVFMFVCIAAWNVLILYMLNIARVLTARGETKLNIHVPHHVNLTKRRDDYHSAGITCVPCRWKWRTHQMRDASRPKNATFRERNIQNNKN